MVSKIQKKERVIAYIDGFNLYFGMREAELDRCRWLDIKKLVTSLLQGNQELVDIKYFTSRVSNNPDKQKRQSTYIDALESIGVKVKYGNYQYGTEECKRCGHLWRTAKEKMTDVNIAAGWNQNRVITKEVIGKLPVASIYPTKTDSVKYEKSDKPGFYFLAIRK